MSIYVALSAVKSELGAIKKGDTMKGGSFSYKYRSIDDVLNALHPILVKHGVVGPVPEVVTHSQSGKKTVIVSKFTWYHTDGSSITGATVGEGDDPGDKGGNKASTGALKTFLTQSLAIPFDTDDPDHYPSQSEAKAEAKSAAKSYDTGTAAPPAQGSATGERTCATCTYAIAASDPIKRKAGAYHHKACFEGTPETKSVTAPTPVAADDIASIIDNFSN